MHLIAKLLPLYTAFQILLLHGTIPCLQVLETILHSQDLLWFLLPGYYQDVSTRTRTRRQYMAGLLATISIRATRLQFESMISSLVQKLPGILFGNMSVLRSENLSHLARGISRK
jgi:hypothetical protein